ncbi:MAG: fibronectin type III domain-containing protein [Actinomycetota bacterium]
MRLIAVFGIFVFPLTALAACGNSSDDQTSEMNKSQTDEDKSEKSGEVKEEASAEEESEESTPEPPVETEEESEESTPEPPANTEEASSEEQEAAIEAILTRTYLWGDGTAYATRELQEILETNVDGTYGMGTRLAHLAALEERGLPTDNVPSEPTVPGQPTNVSVYEDGSVIIIDWDPPADNGGSEITWYSVTSAQLSGVFCNRTATDGVRDGSPCTFDSAVGVVSGVSYTFSITATNATGVSEPLVLQPISLPTQQITMNLNSRDCSSWTDDPITENGITFDPEVASQWGGFNANGYATGTVDGSCGYENAIWAYDDQDDVEFGFTNNANYSCLRLSQISIRAWFNGPFPEFYGTLQLDTVILHLLKNGSIVDSIYTGLSIAAGTADTGSPVGVTVPISNQTCDITGMYVETVQTGSCDEEGGPGFCDPFHFFFDNLIFIADAPGV